MTSPEALVGSIVTSMIMLIYLSVKKDMDDDLRVTGVVISILYPFMLV